MSPSFMDIARARKREAEAQILEILQKLQKDTELAVVDVEMKQVKYLDGASLITSVTITMEM